MTRQPRLVSGHQAPLVPDVRTHFPCRRRGWHWAATFLRDPGPLRRRLCVSLTFSQRDTSRYAMIPPGCGACGASMARIPSRRYQPNDRVRLVTWPSCSKMRGSPRCEGRRIPPTLPAARRG
jgi:hypothetical protein